MLKINDRKKKYVESETNNEGLELINFIKHQHVLMADNKEVTDDNINNNNTRRTSLPQPPCDHSRRRKSSGICQTKLLTTASDSDEGDSAEPDNYTKWNAREVAADNGCEQTRDVNTDSISETGNMAFSAVVCSGGGGYRTPASRRNSEEVEYHENTRSVSINTNRETVKLNVGGQLFETYKSTLKRLKSCKLSREHDMRKYFREEKGDYFFDRDPQVFSVVLNYLRTGELHLPTYLCGPAVQNEFKYWGIDENDIERCCWQPYNTWKTQNRSLEKLEHDRKRSTTQKDLEKDRRSKNCWIRCRALVWNFLQNPNSSVWAKVYAWVSIAFVLLSIFSFCAETHPLFHVKAGSVRGFDILYNVFVLDENKVDNAMKSATTHSTNSSIGDVGQNSTHNNRSSEHKETEWVTHPALLIIDLICVSYFSLEFLVRFIFCPRKLQFVTALQNIIDFIAIVPDYVTFILQAVDPSERDALPFVDFILILRMLRLCRIFRLIRHVPGLWILLYTLKASVNELMLMFVFLLIGMIVFASLMHFAESEMYSNIPIGFWWSVVTMTTVGYGDMCPKTFAGYIIGSICAISGLLMIAFTVPIIVSNFVLYYTHVQYGMVQYDRDTSKLLSHVDDEQPVIHIDEVKDLQDREGRLLTNVCDDVVQEVEKNVVNDDSENKNHSTDGNCNKV